jgi:hypothetical protein
MPNPGGTIPKVEAIVARLVAEAEAEGIRVP